MKASSHLIWIRTMAAGKKGLQLSLMIHAMVYAFVLVGLWQIGQTVSPEHAGWVGIVAWGWAWRRMRPCG
jgi:hypothetical protein